ncbi:hypothetical protein [Aeromonas veronii]
MSHANLTPLVTKQQTGGCNSGAVAMPYLARSLFDPNKLTGKPVIHSQHPNQGGVWKHKPCIVVA